MSIATSAHAALMAVTGMYGLPDER